MSHTNARSINCTLAAQLLSMVLCSLSSCPRCEGKKKKEYMSILISKRAIGAEMIEVLGPFCSNNALGGCLL
ncbi:hypothetical protein B0O80DRAFT_26386 [Mortierella sp. GBAus27b]|nr:hypothetical protein B0O80DRAFT_26386 [Mortierella sp. GBAus27b]